MRERPRAGQAALLAGPPRVTEKLTQCLDSRPIGMGLLVVLLFHMRGDFPDLMGRAPEQSGFSI